ncbi:hypothetical protein [Streptomyces sp. H34-S4]|uniref:hypothetical protein n=1 Tax=Streptomyces sp. H34-S4 TaxID=2996463 RepID=UPI0022721A38|nr:hypothetical protein [Streptomyces sp. H34-S4]MCY0936857.1 hypothetical protein [Streptomyces sp. H34-S4]
MVGSRALTGGTFNSGYLLTLAAGQGAPHTDTDTDPDTVGPLASLAAADPLAALALLGRGVWGR